MCVPANLGTPNSVVLNCSNLIGKICFAFSEDLNEAVTGGEDLDCRNDDDGRKLRRVCSELRSEII